MTKYLVAALMLFVAGASSSQEVDSLVIRQNQVGRITIGMRAEDICWKLGTANCELVDLALEGFVTPALSLTLPGTAQRGGVIAELGARDSQLVVWRITITDPNFRTEKGIGVGSTVEELRAAYTLDGVAEGEGRLSVGVKELSAGFQVGQGYYGFRSPADVPGTMKVIRIFLR